MMSAKTNRIAVRLTDEDMKIIESIKKALDLPTTSSAVTWSFRLVSQGILESSQILSLIADRLLANEKRLESIENWIKGLQEKGGKLLEDVRRLQEEVRKGEVK